MSFGGSGEVTMNATFRIDGNDIVNTRELKRTLKADLGTNEEVEVWLVN